jgi:hypothetical protein
MHVPPRLLDSGCRSVSALHTTVCWCFRTLLGTKLQKQQHTSLYFGNEWRSEQPHVCGMCLIRINNAIFCEALL